MPPNIEILCIGHASYDIILPLASFPVENSKCEIYSVHNSGGGPAANAAYLLSKWGVHTAFAGLAGDDEYGRLIRDEFASVGTDTSLLELRPGHVTPLSIIMVSGETASRTIINRKAPAQKFDPAWPDISPKILLFDGHELEASLSAFKRFSGAKSILDAGSLRPGTQRLAREVDFVAASERFAKQYCGVEHVTGQTQEQCLRKLQVGNRPVVITLGERGLIYNDGKGICSLPAFKVNAVDTTAAGDVFHGAFAYGILKGFSFEKTLELASMAAGISVTRNGSRASIPELGEVLEKLNWK